VIDVEEKAVALAVTFTAVDNIAVVVGLPFLISFLGLLPASSAR
jgi:hypothetical protein